MASSVSSRRRTAKWTKPRDAQRQALYTLKFRRERNRQAQARYRERHAERLALVRKISAILKRQSWHQDDAAVLVAALRTLAGDECIRALGRELSAARTRP
jgi:hypothetical protein